VEDSCEHGNEPLCSIKCWEILKCCATGGFSRRPQLHEVSYLVSQFVSFVTKKGSVFFIINKAFYNAEGLSEDGPYSPTVRVDEQRSIVRV
jgi:hypothetical protein